MVVLVPLSLSAEPRKKVEFTPNLRASEDTNIEEVVSAPAESAPKKKLPKSPGFNQYARMFSRWCQLLEKDGRKESMFEMLDYITDEFAECPGCRGFIRSFAFPCKPKPKPKQISKPKPEATVEGEPAPEPTATPTPRPLAREPGTELLDSISRGLIELREDPKRANDVAVAVDRLVKELRDPAHKEPGARDYFDVLAEYLYAPMAELLRAPAPESSGETGPKATPAPPQVDDLFSF